MKPNRIVKAGVIVLVIAAVAVVLVLKQADPASSGVDPPVSISSMMLADQSVSPPAAPQPDVTGAARRAPVPSRADAPPVDVALPRLLDLGADKCIPCKKMAPILKALREEYAGRFEVVFIDVWKNRQAAGPYGIKLIPTQIFFDEEGNEVFRHEGFFSREDILAAWSDLGYAFGASPVDEAG